MHPLVVLLYAVFSLVYWVLAIFIVYHIRRYMLNRASANTIVSVFLAGMIVLYAVNFSFFLSLPLRVSSGAEWIGR